jgi:hypothetical protein
VGVPNTGVTNVGDVLSTLFPDPVDVVTPVPPLVTPNVPVTCVVRLILPDKALDGYPVALVNVALEGVPKAGVTNVGDVFKTTEPEPVDVVTPVPPLVTASVPDNVTAPVVAVLGVSPVVPALNEDTLTVEVTFATSPVTVL